MNVDIAKGKWKELKGKARAQWGDLTDEDLDRIEGRREQFVGIMQQKFGKAKDAAEREFDRFRDTHAR